MSEIDLRIESPFNIVFNILFIVSILLESFPFSSCVLNSTILGVSLSSIVEYQRLTVLLHQSVRKFHLLTHLHLGLLSNVLRRMHLLSSLNSSDSIKLMQKHSKQFNTLQALRYHLSDDSDKIIQ